MSVLQVGKLTRPPDKTNFQRLKSDKGFSFTKIEVAAENQKKNWKIPKSVDIQQHTPKQPKGQGRNHLERWRCREECSEGVHSY